jgi:hypothetical protein
MMDYDVVEARYVGGYVVWLRFRDGMAGEIDLWPELHGPVFEPLRDPIVFRQFQIHPEFQTLTWPNGADRRCGYNLSAVLNRWPTRHTWQQSANPLGTLAA